MKQLLLALLLCCGWSVGAQAQTTPPTVGLDLAKFSWTWTPAANESATTFRLYCGSATGSYSTKFDTGDTNNLSCLVNAVVTAPGLYFCAASTFSAASNLESKKSNEVSFRAVSSPTSPTGFTLIPQ